MVDARSGSYRKMSMRVSGDDVAHANFQRILLLTGEVTLAWAQLEDRLVLLLHFLSGATWSASEIMYYSPSSFSGRLAIIKNLIQHEMPDGPEKALIDRTIDRIQRLSKARNTFVHSVVAMNIGAVKAPYLTRTVWQPHRQERKDIYRTTPADIEGHLAKLGSVYQLVFFLTSWSVSSKTVRHWAALAVSWA